MPKCSKLKNTTTKSRWIHYVDIDLIEFDWKWNRSCEQNCPLAGGGVGGAWVWVWRMPCQVGWQVFALPLFPFEPHWWKELGLPSVWMHWEVQLIIFWWSWGNEDTPWQITMTNPMFSKSSAKMAFGKIRARWLEGHWTNTLALWRVHSHGESLSWTFPEV